MSSPGYLPSICFGEATESDQAVCLTETIGFMLKIKRLPIRTIDRFLLSEFLLSLAFFFALFISIATVLVIFEELDTLLENNASFGISMIYILLCIPHQIVKATPLIVVLAVVSATANLVRNREMLMLFVAGYTPARIAAPLSGLLVVFIMLSFLLNEFVAGPAAMQAERLQTFFIKGGNEQIVRLTGIWMYGENDQIYHVREYYPTEQSIEGLTVFEFNRETMRVMKRLDAQKAMWDSQEGAWTLYQVAAHYIQPNGTVEREYYDAFPYLIGRTPDDFTRVVQQDDPERMSYSELARVVEDVRRSGEDPLIFLPDLRIKEAFPFAVFFLGILAFSLMLLSGAQSQASGIGLGLVAGIGYFLSLSLGKSFAITGFIPPWIGAWTPNFLCLILSVWVFYRLQKDI